MPLYTLLGLVPGAQENVRRAIRSSVHMADRQTPMPKNAEMWFMRWCRGLPRVFIEEVRGGLEDVRRRREFERRCVPRSYLHRGKL